MQTRVGLIVPLAFWLLISPSVVAQRGAPSALTGRITSAEEGPMEGVLVSVRKGGSTITTTVVSDREGRYRFPRARLEPGEYTVRIRAIGYDLERAPSQCGSRAGRDARSI